MFKSYKLIIEAVLLGGGKVGLVFLAVPPGTAGLSCETYVQQQHRVSGQDGKLLYCKRLRSPFD